MAARVSTSAVARPSARKEARTHTTSTAKTGTELGPMATRGRRKLDFTSQRFRGKIFFLDLAGYKRASEVERELTQRGATVEKFFNRGVRYLITTRGKGGKGASAAAVSPSTPSPQTPGGGVSSSSVPAHYTRAQKLIHLSNSGSCGKKVDLLSKAAEWGCKVVSLEELLAELRKLTPLPPPNTVPQGESKGTINGRQAKVRKLVAPFLKAEDLSRGYCPLVYEGKGAWPSPDAMCSPKGCPYDTPNKRVRADHTPQVAAVRASVTRPPAAESQTAVSAPAPPPLLEAVARKPGYCECCATRYSDLTMHLRSARHLEYACNDANFTRLDTLIAEGTSFSTFLSSRRHGKRSVRASSMRKGVSPSKSHPTESVILVTPPPSPIRGQGSPARSPAKRLQKPRARTTPTKRQGKSPTKTTPTKRQRGSPKKTTPTKRQRNSPVKTTPIKRQGKSPQKTTPTKKQGKSPSKATPTKFQGKSPSPTRNIIKLEGDFLSLRHGELCLTPVSPNMAVPPAVASPFSGAKINAIANRLINNLSLSGAAPVMTTSTPTAGTKRKACSNDRVHSPPPSKRQRRAKTVDVVPETPERASKSLCRHSSPLCNLRDLFERSKHCVQVSSPSVTGKRSHDASSSPATSLRKSPRLIEQERKQKLQVKTVKVKKFFLPPKHSLTVSYKLNHVYLKPKQRQPTPPDTSLQPAPQLVLERALSPTRRRTPTATAATASTCSSAWSFPGFTPDSVAKAVPPFAMALRRSSPGGTSVAAAACGVGNRTQTSEFSFSGFTPNSVQNAKPAFAMSLRSSPKSGPCDESRPKGRSWSAEEARKKGACPTASDSARGGRSLRRTRLSFSSSPPTAARARPRSK